MGPGVSSADDLPYGARAIAAVADELLSGAEGVSSWGSYSFTTASYFLLLPTNLVMWALRLV